MTFSNIGIRATNYRVPKGYVSVKELAESNKEYVRRIREETLQIPKLRTVTLDEVEGVHRFTDEEPGRLVLAAAREVIEKEGIQGRDISLLLDFSTCSRDKKGVSLSYRIQHELGAENAMTIALGNGSCSSLQFAFKVADALMKTHQNMKYALLLAEDRVNGYRYHPPAHVLGDGASVVLLEKDCAKSSLADTAVFSIGRFCDIMGIEHGNIDNYDIGDFENRVVPIHYKVINDLVAQVLKNCGLRLNQIDLILYQNMCRNDYHGLIHALGVDAERIFHEGLRGHGHIMASDLVVNYHLAEAQGRLAPVSDMLLISSGAGFSWGATVVHMLKQSGSGCSAQSDKGE